MTDFGSPLRRFAELSPAAREDAERAILARARRWTPRTPYQRVSAAAWALGLRLSMDERAAIARTL
jgi:hypothetical protein